MFEKTKKWCKDHKKEIMIVLGFAAAAVGVYAIAKKHDDSKEALLNNADVHDDVPEEPDYDDVEYIDDDIFSDLAYNIEGAVFDCDYWNDTRTYTLENGDTKTVTTSVIKNSDDFTTKVERMHAILPDVDTDVIIDVLKDLEPENETDEIAKNTDPILE